MFTLRDRGGFIVYCRANNHLKCCCCCYLYPEEGCEEDVGEDDEVDLVEEAPEHQDHQDKVHYREHSQRHILNQSVFSEVLR